MILDCACGTMAAGRYKQMTAQQKNGDFSAAIP
jgi:hypothetical protein